VFNYFSGGHITLAAPELFLGRDNEEKNITKEMLSEKGMLEPWGRP
jgi:hypothetical protein